MSKKNGALFTYIFFLLTALVTLWWGKKLAQHHTNIRLWSWPDCALLLIGLPFILLQKQAGLPDVWDTAVSNRQRIWLPLATGFFFAVLDIIVVIIILHPQPFDTLPPFLQPFPYSVPLYISGAFDIEVFYRLIPITLVLLLTERCSKNKKTISIVFWIMAILTALHEPIEQFPEGVWWFVLYSFISGFAMNLLQAICYRKSGFLASMMVRLGHYLLWHILLGIYVEYFQFQ
jgi:hypothetical protein